MSKKIKKAVEQLKKIEELIESDTNDRSYGKKYENINLERTVNRIHNVLKAVLGESNEYSKRLYDIIESHKEDEKQFRFSDNHEQYIKDLLSILNEAVDFLELELAVDVHNEKFQESKPKELKESKEYEVSYNDKVFIVHGHDNAMKESVARVINMLGLDPIILHERANKGDSLMDKLAREGNVGFVVVILSADDKGNAKTDSEEKLNYRARQNVIFELGFFIGQMGKSRVIALREEISDFEEPSDYKGIAYIPYSNSNDSWKGKIGQELKGAGYKNIDLNKLY